MNDMNHDKQHAPTGTASGFGSAGVPPVSSPLGDVAEVMKAATPLINSALGSTDSFIDHQVSKFKRTTLQVAAIDAGKFTLKTAVCVGAFAACCAIGKAILTRGAPAA